MNEINAKIYYEKANGNILIITSECQGYVESTTKEQDMQIYDQLKNKNIDDVDFIELEYGTLSNTFSNVKSYKVNLDTKQLEVTYYTQEELHAMQQQARQNEDLNSRVFDISTYLNNNVTTIADVEDLILQSEQNKIINEGM
ncbi:MAG: hypothetical protein LKH93_06960 [Clostridium beijerinckii]|jgi:hypothetical protein|nr:hypothetical protein [Clostridium beijerinckii]MCI1578570.1 hypothetical protein [Clostridium beijerinckii]MCI1582098.1 hypothetical protein [Clostridium beijerinckii]MCI1621948.1 hypothetical protein [Clostridium beijerinckii]